ncbi:MAG TPA: ribosome maturation factor RimM [Polyangiales bacterium]|nr:ribosome maturation factor RimM [Polyangiales bacterium]
MSEELVELAAVVRGHALAGELVLKVFNPESDLVASLRELMLRSPTGEITRYKVRSSRGAKEGALVTLEGVTTRDAADALRGHVVCVERATLPALEDGEYYIVDLPGLAVHDTGGQKIGYVEDVIEYPSVAALVVVVEGIVREVPDLPRYLLEVRVADGYVVVDNLEELEPVPLAPLSGKR